MQNNPGFNITVINNIYINIYLPIIYLYYQKLANTEMTESVLESYLSFKALPENYITCFMCNHINSSRLALLIRRLLPARIDRYLLPLFVVSHLCEECKESLMKEENMEEVKNFKLSAIYDSSIQIFC